MFALLRLGSMRTNGHIKERNDHWSQHRRRGFTGRSDEPERVGFWSKKRLMGLFSVFDAWDRVFEAISTGKAGSVHSSQYQCILIFMMRKLQLLQELENRLEKHRIRVPDSDPKCAVYDNNHEKCSSYIVRAEEQVEALRKEATNDPQGGKDQEISRLESNTVEELQKMLKEYCMRHVKCPSMPGDFAELLDCFDRVIGLSKEGIPESAM